MKTTTRPKRKNSVSWIGIVEQLAKMKEGEGVEVPLDASNFTTGNTAIRSGCYRRGFTAVFRRVPGQDVFRIYRKDGVASPRNLVEGKALAERFVNGETLDSIGQSLGVSRQAVDEKIKRVMRFNFLPVHERIETTQVFVQPYLDVLGERSCLLCKQKVDELEHRRNGICGDCRVVIKARTLAAARLRGYLRNPNNRHVLAEALVLIRKYNFQPEDLEQM